MVDLRALLHAALQASGDVEMIEVLQVGREEMPEAIKTLQRALERIGPPEVGLERSMSRKGNGGDGKAKGLKREGTVESTKTSSSGGSGRRKDTLDQEFMESGIDALRRLSASQGIRFEGLPSWTITK
jgi:abelson tyrosine-protein kinase 1